MTTIVDIKFNTKAPEKGLSFSQPTLIDLDTPNFKYADIDFVRLHTTDYIRSILDGVKLVGNRKNVLVDIKVHELTAGKFPAIPFWHIDSVNNPLHPSEPETHHIFVSGEGCLTQFLGAPLTLPIQADSRLNFDLLVPADHPTYTVPSCTICTYGRYDLHRCVRATVNEYRLLLRVTETDVISPINKIKDKLVLSDFRNFNASRQTSQKETD